jgi:hypothetical protein
MTASDAPTTTAKTEPALILDHAGLRPTDRDGTTMVRLTDRSGTVTGTVTVFLPQRFRVGA